MLHITTTAFRNVRGTKRQDDCTYGYRMYVEEGNATYDNCMDRSSLPPMTQDQTEDDQVENCLALLSEIVENPVNDVAEAMLEGVKIGRESIDFDGIELHWGEIEEIMEG